MDRNDCIGETNFKFGDMFLFDGELYIIGYDQSDIPPCIKLGLQDYTNLDKLEGTNFLHDDISAVAYIDDDEINIFSTKGTYIGNLAEVVNKLQEALSGY